MTVTEPIVISQPGTLADRLKNELRDSVRAWEANRPRSKQRNIGASDVGHPCTRYLAYRATGAPEIGQPGDPWPAIVGTSCHEHVLTQAFENDPRWTLCTSAVEIGPQLYGRYDLLRNPILGVTDGAIVIDHKVINKEGLATLKNNNPKQQYRVQTHMYGFGVYRQGIDVSHVAIAGWPRSGFLRDLVVWVEPFNLDVVEDAFQRWYTLKEASPLFTPDIFRALPRVDGPCNFCPWFAPSVAGEHPELACPGVA
jgi:hypothetical protein